jgi:hypothetical protein
MKSTKNNFNKIVKEIKKLHPYEVPEIVCVDITANKDYLNWIKLSPKQIQQSRINKAKAYLNSGPNITNFWNAF